MKKSRYRWACRRAGFWSYMRLIGSLNSNDDFWDTCATVCQVSNMSEKLWQIEVKTGRGVQTYGDGYATLDEAKRVVESIVGK